MNLTRKLSPTVSTLWLLGLTVFTGIIVYMAFNAGALGGEVISKDSGRIAEAARGY